VSILEVSLLPLETIIASSLFTVFLFHIISPHLQRAIKPHTVYLLEAAMNLVFTVLVMGVALTGFYYLETVKAVLWLVFWVWAYPVALAFTKAEAVRNMQQGKLVEMYKEGLTQIPAVGHLLGTVLRVPKNVKAGEEKREQKRQDDGATNEERKP
jgi:hypothetical protein